ncbi:4119_t:CDS:2, partial [Gigaspora rosea]
NLKDELEQQSPIEIFSEDMFSTNVIELKKLIDSFDQTKICEICLHHEMICRSQWGKRFGMMKKTLNLAIITNRTNELYKIHENLTKEMELELIEENNQTKDNNTKEFAHTISNSINIKTKG